MERLFVTREVLESFRECLTREEKSPATIEKYTRDVNAFAVYAGGREVTKELAIGYKEQLQEEGYAVRSINSMLASINSLFVFLGRPDLKVRAIKLQRQIYAAERKELTKTEYFRLVETAKRRDERLCLVLQTICGTGIRVSELEYITVEAVKRGEAVVNCKGKIRTIFIVRELRKRLLEYAYAEGVAEGRIFVTRGGKALSRSNIWRDMKKLCKAANVSPEKVFPHNLRHLFARTFYGLEKDIAKLADILGHSSIETTRIYIMSTGVEHRRKMERMGLVERT